MQFMQDGLQRQQALGGQGFQPGTRPAVSLYRDVAERWHYRGDSERAEAVASRAQVLWLQITRLDQALSVGDGVIRMRNQIPGEDGDALNAALEHRASLPKAHEASGP
ncbi:hypothetical protein [Streptomyces sp. GESEQ-35]|uniref:hypothetical protein n=1 Tax=Streptomyces sp. GESEQ-35 TaxID=2812657 RepID=UPI001B3449EF|nr:hypothetical protein [Streptomyces sp. GESEQ-35]